MAETVPIKVRIGEEEGVPVIQISGELDLATVDTVQDTITRVVDASPATVIFDLGELAFMDSSGLALMLSVAKQVERVELRNPSDIIRRVVEMTGLTEVLQFSS